MRYSGSAAMAACVVLLSLSLFRSLAAETAENSFTVKLPPRTDAKMLVTNSPFGVNTAFHPGTKDLPERLKAMAQAGIKWGRQDFTWKAIERQKGIYSWEPFDALVEQCRAEGLLLFGNLTYGPDFYDLRSDAGVEAYCAFARAAVRRYSGKIDYWQIWNEPNLGYLGGDPQQYARLLSAAGKAIHETNSKAKVLGLNMAFCDVLWTQKILALVPYDCFDIICFHPYRNPNAPEDKFDWWVLDQYVKRFHKELTPDYPLVQASFLEQTDALREAMQKFGTLKPIWVTEMCFNTHIHPYGVSELRSADLLVRFHLLALASGKIDKVFWWTLRDGGPRQFDAADMVGLMREDLSPKYSYYAYAIMTRMLEGKRWVRNDSFGPDVYACLFDDDRNSETMAVLWTPRSYAYVRITNTQEGLVCYDLYGTKRKVSYDKVRTGHLPVPLGESPIYVVGKKGLKVTVRPDPGW